jgi:hypothetical protein
MWDTEVKENYPQALKLGVYLVGLAICGRPSNPFLLFYFSLPNVYVCIPLLFFGSTLTSQVHSWRIICPRMNCMFESNPYQIWRRLWTLS